MAVLLVGGLGLGLLAALAWWWVSLLVSVYQWFLSQPAFRRLGVRPCCSPSGEEGHEISDPEQPNRQPSSRGTPLSSPLTARCTPDLESGGSALFAFSGLVRGTAMDPDFDAFFGGLEAAVAAGGVVVIALVVVLAVRRLTSF